MIVQCTYIQQTLTASETRKTGKFNKSQLATNTTGHKVWKYGNHVEWDVSNATSS